MTYVVYNVIGAVVDAKYGFVLPIYSSAESKRLKS